MKDLSWKPVRRGDVYCSPACGSRCTWAAYCEATTNAVALCKRLGPMWKPAVWENCGWYYRAEIRAVDAIVHPPHRCNPKRFWAAIGGHHRSGCLQYTGEGTTALAAVRMAAARALEGAKVIQDLADALPENVKSTRKSAGKRKT